MDLGPILERHNAFQWTLTLPLPLTLTLPLDVFIPLIEELLGSNPLTAIFCHQIQWIHRHFVVEKLECWHKSLSLLALQSKIHCVSRVVSGRSKWRGAPPMAQNFLNFMQFSRKFWLNHMSVPPEIQTPSYRESWICPWSALVVKTFLKNETFVSCSQGSLLTSGGLAHEQLRPKIS